MNLSWSNFGFVELNRNKPMVLSRTEEQVKKTNGKMSPTSSKIEQYGWRRNYFPIYPVFLRNFPTQQIQVLRLNAKRTKRKQYWNKDWEAIFAQELTGPKINEKGKKVATIR